MTTVRRMGLAPVVIALALGALASCGGRKDESAERAAPATAAAPHRGSGPEIPGSVTLSAAAIAEAGIRTWKVQPMDLEHLVVLTGTVGHDENHLLDVASSLRGRVASIPVDLGQRVRAGEPVVWIESVELSHAWDAYVKALGDLRVAERARERARSLLEAQAISVGETQSREAAALAARVEAATLERSLRLYGEPDDEVVAVRSAVEAGTELPFSAEAPHRVAVRAPFSGTIVERKVTPGSLVEALQPLATVADLSTVWVFVNAYEKDLTLLQKGLTASIRTEAYPQESFPGRIDVLGSVVDPATRTVRVRATVKNPGEKLRPGMFVTARIDVPRPQSEAIAAVAVPHSGLQTLEERTVVFVETAPGVFARRPVEVGHTFEGFTEILGGVKAGEVIVTEGSFVLKSEFAKAMLQEDD